MNKYISITGKKINHFIIYLIILMDCNFFYLISPPHALSRFWGNYVKALLVMIAFAYFILTRSWRVNNRFLRTYTAFFTFSFFFISVMSMLIYGNEKMINHFLQYGGPLLVFFAWPLVLFFKREGGYESFFRMLNIFMVIIYAVLTLQWLLSLAGGPLLVKVPYASTRGGLPRMAYNGLTNFMLVYNICRVYTADKKRKWMHLCMSIVGMFATVFVQQTRAYVISYLLIIILLVLFKPNKTLGQKVLAFLLIVLTIVMFSTGVVTNFLNSFTEGSEVQSTLVRTGAYLYFWETFKANPLFGHGFLTATANNGIKQGPLGYYYYADTGIVGLMAQMGIFGVIAIVWPILHWAKICWNNRNKGLDVFLPLSIVFYISIMPTLLCTAPAQVMMWPVFFAMFAYVESENDLDTEEQSLLVI